MSDKKLNVYTNGYEHIIAEDKDGIREVLIGFYGDISEADDRELDDFDLVPDDRVIGVSYEEDIYESIIRFHSGDLVFPQSARVNRDSEGYVTVLATAAEWAKYNEPTLLCSTEW